MFDTDIPDEVTDEHIKQSESEPWQSKCSQENNKNTSATVSKETICAHAEIF